MHKQEQGYVWRSSENQSQGVGHVVDLVKNENVDVIFGSPSSRITVPAAHLTSYWNFPMITWIANSFELSDKNLFSTLVRTVGPLSESARLIVTMFNTFNWTKIGNLYLDFGLCLYTAEGIKEEFSAHNLTIMQSIAYHPATVLTRTVMVNYLSIIKQTSRIIYICDENNLRRYMILACELGMCNGEYVFITTYLSAPTEDIWKMNDAFDEQARRAFQHIIYINSAKWTTDEGREAIENFQKEVNEKAALPPWNNDYPLRNNITSTSAEDMYNAAYLYGLWVNYSASNVLDVRDGAAMLAFSKNLSFDGIGGPCDIGMNGDRVPFFWMNQFRGEDTQPEVVAISTDKNRNISITHGFEWYTADGNHPLDEPVCGFFGELCPIPENGI
ncbi:receptor-type guanylate cyclase gcy-13-like [Mya arenaria]|uniref:receptor-type guanylate cyclase gcy-13-like n=1 Tax=Mya arenaria TaxID=6604 RepID=UPI0022E74A2C|nr:receptor-type guanylate cyclase gcy-13-like [Mya arenaria]